MSRLSAGEVARLLFDVPDAKSFFDWADNNKSLLFHIEELKQAIPFGQSGAHKDPNTEEVLRYCDIDRKDHCYSIEVPQKKELWTSAEHFARAACRIVRDHDYESGVLSPKRFPTYKERCVAAIHTIRLVRYEHNPTRKGHYSNDSSNHTAPTAQTQIIEKHDLESSGYPDLQSTVRVLLEPGGPPTNVLRTIPDKAEEFSRHVSREIPEADQLRMLQKLGLFLDRTSVPQHSPPDEISCFVDEKNAETLLLLCDWRRDRRTIRNNPVTREVDAALLNFAIVGDLDGFWRLRHKFKDCLCRGW